MSDDEEAGPSDIQNTVEAPEAQEQVQEVVPDVSDDSDDGIDRSRAE